MTQQPAVQPTEPASDSTSIKRVMASGAIGTAVEWYDWQLYAMASAVVFNKLFFPSFDPVVGTLTAFASLGVGFLIRPLGAFVFGHFGDRLGRKRMLVVSLLIMGLASTAIGLLPTYAQIGVWAPILLVFCRLLQGFAVGGEWGGATVLIAEYSPPKRRGLYNSVVQIGSPAGLVFASAAVGAVALLPEEQFLSWGWRIPFLISIGMVGIGLYIRLRISESPAFKAALEKQKPPKVPALEMVRTSKRSLFIAIGARFAPDIGFYVCGTFMVSYVSNKFGFPTQTALFIVAVAAFIEMLLLPAFGWLSDRIGRRTVYLGGAAFWALFAIPYFWLVDTGSSPVLWVATIIGFVIGHGSMWSIGGAMYAEMFGTRVRYSGASLGYQLAVVIGGGPTPFIATALIAWSGGASWPVAGYLVLAAAITFIAVYLLRQRNPDRAELTEPTTARESAG